MVNPVNTIEAQIQPRVLFNFWNPNYVNITDKDAAPSFDHWFGTDVLGRDIFARVLFGSFYSILIGVVATFVSVALGAFIGASSGYLGGTIDQIIQRLTEVLTSMPGLPVLLLVSAAFTPLFTRINLEGAYYLVVFTIFSFISWGGTARIIRSEVLSLKRSEFIQAERVLGATHYRIITKHIMPNAFSTVIIFFTLGVAGNIISVASLAFLGFGSESTLVWGSDLNEAIANQPTEKWWGTTFISLCLFSLVLGFNLMGDVLRDALDPRLKE
jgi:peptide/nickel transport system permease protein